MPDWSYRTVLRPLMLSLGAERARRLAVSTLTTLSRVPFGPRLVDFLGHMRPDPRLRTRAGAVELSGPIALGALIDPRGDALPAFSRFGASLIEVGSVAEQGSDVVPEWRVDLQQRTVDASHEIVVSVADVARNLERTAERVPVAVRIAKQDGAAIGRIIERLHPYASMFIVDPTNVDDARAASKERPILSAETIHKNADGTWLRVEDRQSCLSPRTLDRIRAARNAGGAEAIIIAAGATEPHEAKALLDAGANIVAIDAGLIVSGPGLIKRCNEALLSQVNEPATPHEPAPHEAAAALPAARDAWFWAFLMGVAMFAGGVMAVVIASTRVVLPYDESLCGLTRAQMAALNPRLLPFMAHDRMSLAGAMLSIGIFYSALAWSGIRRGAHWAHVTVIASATVGFLTFFTFLGFGYFDPFHAFVTAILCQFLLLCLVMRPSPAQRPVVVEWCETAAWRRAQWGQLLFILLGVGLTVAGFVITVIGCTTVFVRTDLEFMRTTAAQLALSYERLIPLVAHDRATLGGMLIANGITVWLSAQWGFRPGARWLWLALATGGNIAFLLALAVHVIVGYNDPLHLAPAILGLTVWNVALALTKGWMCTSQAFTAESLVAGVVR